MRISSIVLSTLRNRPNKLRGNLWCFNWNEVETYINPNIIKTNRRLGIQAHYADKWIENVDV